MNKQSVFIGGPAAQNKVPESVYVGGGPSTSPRQLVITQPPAATGSTVQGPSSVFVGGVQNAPKAGQESVFCGGAPSAGPPTPGSQSFGAKSAIAKGSVICF